MFWVTILCLALVSSVTSNSVAAYSTNNGEPFSELPCTAEGGLCVKTSDCPEGKLSRQRGLCPLQQKNDVECCYSVPLSETRCGKNGGECIPTSSRCPENLTFNRATDCGKDKKCCMLVR